MTATIKVDLFADVVCPWCLIGSARLDAAVADLPGDVQVDIENHPFLLDPNTPAEGVNTRERLEEKYGRAPEEMWSRLETEAKASGVPLDPRKQEMTYPTTAAHTLIRHARGTGQQHALATAVAEAYFLEAENIADLNVLARLAQEFGLDPEAAIAVMTDREALTTTARTALWAAEQGINGVPFFVFGGKYALSGCQPQDAFSQAFETALADEEVMAG